MYNDIDIVPNVRVLVWPGEADEQLTEMRDGLLSLSEAERGELFAAARRRGAGRGEELYHVLAEGVGAPLRVEEKHNLLVTNGMIAFAYNLKSANADVISRILLGSGTTTPALGDTTLATAFSSTGDEDHIFSVRAEELLCYGLWVTGRYRNEEVGSVLSEIGLATSNTAATPATNVMIARAVLDRTITIDASTSLVVIYNLVAQWAPRGDDVGLHYGLEHIMSRMYGASLGFDPIDYICFGTSTDEQLQSEQTLKSEVHREAATYSRSAAVLTASGTLTTGTVAGVITEYGPCVGSGSDKVFYQARSGGTSDNAASDTAWAITISFGNVTADDDALLESADVILLESADNLLWEG